MATVVAIVGTIPGAGATSVAAGLGAALGEQRVQVALVDASPEGSRVGDVVALEDGGEVTDALRRSASLAEVRARGPHGLVAFPASDDTNWGAVRPDAVGTVYEQLRERFEVVLVDCGTELAPATAAWLGHADEAVIVTDPDVAASVDETAALAAAFDVSVRGIVGNRVPPTATGDALADLEATRPPVLAVLPEDATVGAAAHADDSVFTHEPDSPIANCLWRLGLRFREADHGEAVVPRGSVGTGRSTRSAGVSGTAGAGEAASPTGARDVPGHPGGEAAGGPRSEARPGSGRAGRGPSGGEGAGSTTGDATAGDDATADTAPRDGDRTDRPDRETDSPSDADSTGEFDFDRGSPGPSDGADADASTAGREPGTESGELSDEEIEEVFKETMQRVKKQREADED